MVGKSFEVVEDLVLTACILFCFDNCFSGRARFDSLICT